MGGVNLATAYVRIIPTVEGIQGSLAQQFAQMGSGAAGLFADQFTRDAAGRLHDGAGRFVQELGVTGQRAGEEFTGGFGGELDGFFSGGIGKVLKAGALLGAVGEIADAAGAAFSSTFGEAMERESSAVKTAAGLGLSVADSKELGASAGKIYAQAYGESIGEVTDTLGIVKSSLKDLSGADLEAATKTALSFSSAFDVDVSRSVQSVSTLIGSGLVKNSTEAFDVLTKASQKVPAALREDVLDASDEYGQFFNSLGFNASEAFGALTAASDKGVFGIDKTGDAIKEFTIRATDMSTSSVGAFQAIGLDAQSMANDILAGGDTAQSATQKIVDGLLNIKDPATQANTAIALFGTPLEDLGVSNIPQFLSSLDDATGGLGDFTGAASEVDSMLGGTIESKFTSLTRTLAGFGPTISSAFLPVLGPVLDGLTGLATKAQASIQGASDNITGFFAAFSQETSSGLSDSQVKWFNWGKDLEATVAGPLATVKSYAQDTRAALSTLVTGDFDPSQWFAPPEEDSALVGFLLDIRTTVGDTFGELVTTGKQVWDQLAGPLTEAFSTVWEAVQPLVPTFLQLFQAFNPIGLLFKALLPILPQIAGVVGDLAKVLAEGVAKALKAVTPLLDTVVGVINRLMPFITQLVASLLPPFVALIDKLSPLLDAILDALIPVVDALVDALIPAIDALMPVVERVFGFVADTIGNIVTVIGGVIDFITGVFTGDWEKVWTGVKEIFGGIWDQIKNIFSTLWDVLVEFFTNLGPRLWDIVTGLADQLVQWGGQFLGWIWQGIQDLWNNTIWPWFVGLPGLVWSGIQAAAGQMVTWGGEFLSWLWNGITSFFTDTLGPWFASLPQLAWDALIGFVGSAGGWVVDRGSEFIGWIKSGIENGAQAIWDFFTSLPSRIWNAISGLWTSLGAWGAEMIKSISEGIEKGGPYLGKALWDVVKSVGSVFMPGIQLTEDAFNISGSIDSLIAEYESQQRRAAQFGAAPPPGTDRGGLGGLAVRATGGLFGPVDGSDGGQITAGTHGTADDVLIRGSRDEFMVNAADTRRTLPLLLHINAGGNPWDLFPGFADGGLIGSFGNLYGLSFMRDKLIPYMTDQLKASFERKIAGQAVAASGGQWGPATDGSRLADNTQAARDFITRRWGITNIGGVYGGSVQGSDHPIGKALDVMIANYLSASGIAQGTSVADWFVANPNAYGTKYVIWRDRINQGGTWAPYRHPSGSNDTLQHRDHVHLSFLTGAGRFQERTAAPADDRPTGLLGQLVNAVAEKFSAAVSSVTPDGVAGGAYPPLVERWRPLVTDVLTKVGQYKGLNLLPFVDRGLLQINSESSGNPDAINLYDINAQRGDPSIGLLQVIRSTFTNALRGTPFEDLIALGQRDPRASVTASTLYSLGRYGSLDRAWQGKAYDDGGWLLPGVPGINLLNRPEAVLTPPQSQALVTHAAALEAGWWGGAAPTFQIFVGDREITDIVDVRILQNDQALVARTRQMQVQGR